MSSIIQTTIGLGVISLLLVACGYFLGTMPGKADFALSFAVYAAIRANEEN